jgi:hypothetical protein
MPVPLSGLASTAAGGKVYAIGGSSPYVAPMVSTVQEYDPGTNGWTLVTPMPTARVDLAAAELGGKIYAVGGSTNGPAQDVLEIYDPSMDSWTSGPPMPTGRFDLAAVALDGLVYALGGSGGSNGTTVEAFDPVAGTWTAMPSMSQPHQEFAAVAMNGKIYVFGAYIEVFDPLTAIWDSLGFPSTSASFAVVLGDSVYFNGGSRSVTFWDTVLDRTGNVIPLRSSRSRHAMVSLGDRVYVFGGWSNDSVEVLTGATRLFVHRKD